MSVDYTALHDPRILDSLWSWNTGSSKIPALILVAKRVKYRIPDSALRSWLQACTGTMDLFTQFDCTPSILLSLSAFTNIRFLTVEIRILLGTTVPLPLFLTVTHLQILAYTTESALGKTFPSSHTSRTWH
ncbi:hypothetical protein C8R45DRAFT_1090270 [Mycena sanguinolenta]|nr:hypothetical protein C8R45DRAFT_1090270 [Mycena sanguinolenta]